MGRLELLLMRVHDGVATPEEHQEFAALGGADAAAGWASARAQLVGAVQGTVDVADDVLAALEPAPWGDALREAVSDPVDVVAAVMEALDTPAWAAPLRAAVGVPVDVTDAVMAALEELPAMELMAFADGEIPAPARGEVARRLLRDVDARAAITAQAQLGAAVRDLAVEATPVDVWDDVAAAIGAEPGAVPEWEPVAETLRSAVAARAPIDVAGAVMARVGPRRRPVVPWRTFAVPAGIFAAAAAALIAVSVGTPVPSTQLTADVHKTLGVDLLLAAVNDARVEDMETAGDVVAQVVQFEDGGPTFILLDDPDGAHDADGSGVPL